MGPAEAEEPEYARGASMSRRRATLAALAILPFLAGPADLVAGNLVAEMQGFSAELASQPAQPLRNKETIYTLRLRDSRGNAVGGAKATLAGRMADGMTVLAPLRPTGEPGAYSGKLIFTMEGDWRLRARVVGAGEPFELQLTEHVAR